LIAHWPDGIKRKGEIEAQPGHLVDIMATCVEVAGASYPAEYQGHPIKPMEGRSLVPAFSGKPIQRDALFWEHEENRAIRVGDWKLVALWHDHPWELYDMAKDRTEMNNLARAEPQRVKEMATLWEKWARRTQALPWPWGKPYGVKEKESSKQ
jgi:arylsulfatase